MFVVAGMFCWSMSTIIRIMQAIPVKDIPNEMLFLQATLLPNQGTFNLLVYVGPSLLHKFCRNTGHDEVLVSTHRCISLQQGTEQSESDIVANIDETISDYDEGMFSFSRSPTTALQKFRDMNERMSFFDRHGRLAIGSTNLERLLIEDHQSTSELSPKSF